MGGAGDVDAVLGSHGCLNFYDCLRLQICLANSRWYVYQNAHIRICISITHKKQDNTNLVEKLPRRCSLVSECTHPNTNIHHIPIRQCKFGSEDASQILGSVERYTSEYTYPSYRNWLRSCLAMSRA